MTEKCEHEGNFFGSTCPFCRPDGSQQQQRHCRPESYSTKGPAIVSDKPKLSVEQVHAELRKELARLRRIGGDPPGTLSPRVAISPRIDDLIDQLPRVDVVEECHVRFDHEMGLGAKRRDAMRAALRRYLELRGLPADPELEGK